MSCCGGNCGCGSGCKCGDGCGGCKMYPGMDEGVTTSQTLVMGVAPSSKPSFEDGGAAAATGAENDGCKCGPNCSCNPCTCKATGAENDGCKCGPNCSCNPCTCK